MNFVHRRTVMNAERIDRALRRIADEILEKSNDSNNVALIGVRSGGVNPTLRIANHMKEAEKIEVPVGMVDITLYRDDLSSENKPLLRKTEIDFDVTDKCVILIDDVLFTGRTIRAAIDAIMTYGRPSCIRAAVLVDRGHRELPIQPDFVGYKIETDEHEKVEVVVGQSKDRSDKVVIVSTIKPEGETQ